MASKLEAMGKHGPRIVPGKPVDDKGAVKFLTMDTGQTDGEAQQSKSNILRMLRFYLIEGRSVYLDDLGGFYPEIRLDGSFVIHFRSDPDLVDYVRSNFQGVIENAENIGKSLNDLIALWNADPVNADDQIPTP